MEEFSLSGITGCVMIDDRRPLSDGTYPLKYRVTFQRERIYIRTGYSMSKANWEKIDYPRIHKDLAEIRNLLSKGVKELENEVANILKRGEYSHKLLLRILKKGRSESLRGAYNARISLLEKRGQIGTAEFYSHAIKKIETYESDLYFSDVTVEWLSDFEIFALKTISISTLSMYLRTLRTLFNSAISAGIIPESTYPFSRRPDDGKYVIREGTGTKIALTLDELIRFINYVPDSRAQQRSKDLFLLQLYLGGINIRDLLLLTWSNIQKEEIVYKRQKTVRTVKKEVVIRIPITPEAQSILDTRGNIVKAPNARIIPYIPIDATPEEIRRKTLTKVREINRHMYKIEEKLGIKGLCDSVSRHTFATITKNAGLSESFIKEALGHTSIKTTQRYLKAFETNERKTGFETINSIVKKAYDRKYMNKESKEDL